MGSLLLFLILLNTGISHGQQSENKEEQTNHKFISANIRVALKEDYTKGTGWNDRKELVFEALRDSKADIMCFQEVLQVQNADLKAEFPEYFSIGFEGPEMDTHRDDEYHGIAKNPIMFSKRKYELISAGTYWLSETPHLGGSKSWNTARARNVNWVRLRDRTTNKEFRVINVHLDHISNEAREQQAAMILEECGQYPKNFKQVLTGDFNADANSDPIKLLKTEWQDSYSAVHGNKDPGFTAHAFQGKEYGKNSEKKAKGKIDFIFYKGGVKATSAKIIRDDFNGVYPSDHYFITADLSI